MGPVSHGSLQSGPMWEEVADGPGCSGERGNSGASRTGREAGRKGAKHVTSKQATSALRPCCEFMKKIIFGRGLIRSAGTDPLALV